MADLFKWVKVSIHVNGKPLPEYASPEAAEADTTWEKTRYIQTVEDAAFSVHVEVNHKIAWRGATSLALGYELDGHDGQTKCMLRSEMPRKGSPSIDDHSHIAYCVDGQKYEAEIRFGTLEKSERKYPMR